MKTNNRNKVRLTESQLKQMIAESVKNVLNEYYYDIDDWETNERNNAEIDYSEFIYGLNNGYYDDKVFDEKWVSKVKDYFDDYDSDLFYEDVTQDISSRRAFLDKDYAMKYHYRRTKPRQQ